jgi:hypothetical protein
VSERTGGDRVLPQDRAGHGWTRDSALTFLAFVPWLTGSVLLSPVTARLGQFGSDNRYTLAGLIAVAAGTLTSAIAALLLRSHPEPAGAKPSRLSARAIAFALLAWLAAFEWTFMIVARNPHGLVSPYPYATGALIATPTAWLATRWFRSRRTATAR